MLYVHTNFPDSPRKSDVPHTAFLNFSALLQNDKNVYDFIALARQNMSIDAPSIMNILFRFITSGGLILWVYLNSTASIRRVFIQVSILTRFLFKTVSIQTSDISYPLSFYQTEVVANYFARACKTVRTVKSG